MNIGMSSSTFLSSILVAFFQGGALFRRAENENFLDLADGRYLLTLLCSDKAESPQICRTRSCVLFNASAPSHGFRRDTGHFPEGSGCGALGRTTFREPLNNPSA